jgi:hypothetical protein
MTRRQILRLQCRLRRGVNVLYHGYLESVLGELRAHDRSGEINRAIASLPSHRARDHVACAPPRDRAIVHRELKLRGDLGCARVREQLWRLQHLPFDLPAAGQAAHH